MKYDDQQAQQHHDGRVEMEFQGDSDNKSEREIAERKWCCALPKPANYAEAHTVGLRGRGDNCSRLNGIMHAPFTKRWFIQQRLA